MSSQYILKLGSIAWHVGQGKAVYYSIIECDMISEEGKREDFKVKVEASLQFRDYWRNKLGDKDFTKFVCLLIEQEIQKRGFPPQKNESGLVEITCLTTQSHPSIHLSQQDLKKYESINEFIVQLP